MSRPIAPIVPAGKAARPPRKVLKSGTQSFQPNYGINNRISTNIGFAPNYDNDGDLLGDPVSAQQDVNAFDAEGRAVTLEGIGVTYDALGRAVEAAEPGGAIEFLYGPEGGKLAVMNGQTLGAAYIPLPGGGTAVYHGGTLAYYRHADALGSSRLASTPGRALYSATAYAPYGEHHEEAGTIDRDFTGQNQDIDSSHSGGQYDFLDREFNAIQGRWWTPDPAGLAAVDPNNPQSWNRYADVGGQPLSFVDPFGLDRVCINDGLGTIQCVDTSQGGLGAGGNGGGGGDDGGPCRFLASRAGRGLLLAAAPPACGGGGGGGGGGGNYQITAQPPKGPVCVSPEAINALLADRPMSGEGQYFYDAGQEYNVNPALAVAIAGAESTFGENTNATWGYWNAWGWGNSPSLHSIGQGWTSWNQGILKVSWQLGMSTKYLGATPPLTTATAIYANWCTAGNCASGLATINSILSGFGVQPGNSLAFAACTEEGH